MRRVKSRILYEQILDKIHTCSFDFFERLVIDLLIKMGYGGSREEAGQATQKTGDGGIDGNQLAKYTK